MTHLQLLRNRQCLWKIPDLSLAMWCASADFEISRDLSTGDEMNTHSSATAAFACKSGQRRRCADSSGLYMHRLVTSVRATLQLYVGYRHNILLSFCIACCMDVIIGNIVQAGSQQWKSATKQEHTIKYQIKGTPSCESPESSCLFQGNNLVTVPKAPINP